MANIKLLLVVLLLFGISSVGLYIYMHTESFDLLREAEALRDSGDIYAAHEKAKQAIEKDFTNRRAIALKSELFFEVQNDTNYKNALTSYQAGRKLLSAGNAKEAQIKFVDALGMIDNISTRAKQFEKGKELERAIMLELNAVNDKISDSTYNEAMRFVNAGEIERAFEYIQLAPNETAKVVRLKSDLAYSIGKKRYDIIIANPSSYADTYFYDAIYYLGIVDKNSDKMADSRKLITELNDIVRKRK